MSARPIDKYPGPWPLRHYDLRDPESVAAAEEAVRELTRESRPSGALLDFHHALLIAEQGHAGAAWVRQARILWIEYALDDWEKVVAEVEAKIAAGQPVETLLFFEVEIAWPLLAIGSLDSELVIKYLYPAYVGEERHRLAERFSGIIETIMELDPREEREKFWYRATLEHLRRLPEHKPVHDDNLFA